MDVWNYILGYRNTLKSVFETWVVHIPFNALEHSTRSITSRLKPGSEQGLNFYMQINID